MDLWAEYTNWEMREEKRKGEKKLTITPLGGLGEIGLNCQLWESQAGVVMVDCGLMFPDDAHLGVDFLVPHFGAVRSVRDRLLGIVLTHGHEDHIGALPWIVPELSAARIYGSGFTLALVEHKLHEHDLLSHVELVEVAEREAVRLGDMTFNFFPVCHSIPEGFGLGVETPVGRIVHSGDFKIDRAPLAGPGTNLEDFRLFAGADGARLLLSDSTNALRHGRSLTEREVMDALEKVFSEASGRIVITLFSSHIQRIQEVFDLAGKHGKTVVISGKSLATNIEIAQNLGLCRLPPNFYNAYDGVPDIDPQNMVLLVTGAQGEPLSALSRMVFGGHRQLAICDGDTVVMSSRVIPGNARAIARLINEMCRLGAEVLYESSHAVHASGHAHADELKEMIKAVRPELFVPVHGEFQHLVGHGRLAAENGVKPDNIIRLENGQPLTLYEQGFVLEPSIPVDCTLVDGKGVGDVGATVLRERRILGDEGVVVVSIVMDAKSGTLLDEPEIVSHGFVFEQQLSHVLDDAREIIYEELAFSKNPARLRENIRMSLRRFFKRVLERDPIVVVTISTPDRAVLANLCQKWVE